MQLRHRQSYACCGIWLLGILYLGCPNANAQSSKERATGSYASIIDVNKLQPLTIGDEMPDVLLDKIINYATTTSRTGDFKDKLLILDFMATGCKGCIEVIPKFDSLQRRFGNSLQIFLVTYEKEERVKAFLTKNKIGKQTNLAFITEDSSLQKLFPHEYISHVVWVNNSQVKAITRTQYVNDKNIQVILSGEKINWPVKRDITEYDYTQPLFSLNEVNIPEFSLPYEKFHSAFTTYLNGVPRRYTETIDSTNGLVVTRMINYPIIDMYLESLSQSLRFPLSYMILDVKDIDKLVYEANDNYRDVWKQENNFCYEAVFPFILDKKKRNEKIRSDLNFYLGLNGRMEKRKIKCLLLVNSGNNELLQTKMTNSYYDPEDTKQPRQTSISSLLYRLNHSWYSRPVIDETGYAQKMYLELSKNDFSNLEQLRKSIKKYGLDLKEEEREVEMFVLTEEK